MSLYRPEPSPCPGAVPSPCLLAAGALLDRCFRAVRWWIVVVVAVVVVVVVVVVK